ncbi:uncharacterized protein MYCGRDRAFT_96806 [Zymoseptoria tritici IPO323]|uniref:Uncharacterized protein n=1 Tax=Zymoseptoria tritici (strain CBS 115943 / IPO323) TaxID=336722 RepID=F9XM67_ZYMTI|nr:uncharacterized protein MYCGRDRAFT_96806 [Zymoseptoria tritici IPO323]EGP83502.1 hypothetical protein MYCGRDRAFT_96806 [Zymoseptoria tritici IPO323]
MASNKFFTWTKGDKKHVSTGMIPIPIEYISIKGMEHGRNVKRSSKAGRKPIPLDFARDFGSNTSSRSNDSVALHDAAIKSATSLMAVMNDMLKSPPLNAHFLSAQKAEERQPWHGRPRSRTAPSTPMYEAPGMEPAELEGSMPAWPQEYQHNGGTPPRPSRVSAAFPRRSCDSYSRKSANRKPSTSHTSNTSEDTLVGTESDALPYMTKRPSLNVREAEQTRSISNDNDTATSQPVSEQSITAPPTYDSSREEHHRAQTDELVSQIMALRASHDAHIASLQKTHEREVASHRSYIEILEKQRENIPKVSQTIGSLEIAPETHATTEVQTSATKSATTSQHGRPTFDIEPLASSDSAVGTEALVRELCLARNTQAEHRKAKTERDILRDSNNSHDREILQLQEIIRQAKDSEKTMLDKIARLEAALCMGNLERTDVLEGLYEARNRAKSMSDQQKLLIEERDQARDRLSSIDPEWTAKTTANTSSGTEGSTISQHSMQSVAVIETQQQELDDLRQKVGEKDARIRELTRLNLDTTGIEENELLIRQLEACQKQLSGVKAEREEYNNLLHAELRRQSQSIAIKLHTATPQINDDVQAIASQKLQIIRTELDDQCQLTAEQRCEYLEKELKHCIQEIVLYKMNIRGYKKDLKKAQARVQSLQAQQVERPQTPNSIDSSVGSDRPSRPSQESGLGISLPRQADTDTPTRHSAPPRRTRHSSAATTLHHQAPTNTASISTPSPAPPRSARLPLAVHKELPATPSVDATTGSWRTEGKSQQPTITRAETLRSVSDSIISSYAKRGTPEMETENFPIVLPLSTARWRSTGPATYVNSGADVGYEARLEGEGRGVSAIAVPVLRFKRGTLLGHEKYISKGRMHVKNTALIDAQKI